jgi:CBS domain containing-hemolysin-like protein
MTALGWLLLNIFSIAVLAFYSMSEMAAVSFNKIRLQYYVSQGNKRAQWLSWLLQNPTRLFSTTLIGVNVATIFGSEFAREFFEGLGLDPDLSPLIQVVIVVIFGELAPMFAARRYAEHVIMLGVPFLYLSAILFSPFIWVFSWLTDKVNAIFRAKETQTNIFLTQEELKKILEDQEGGPIVSEKDEMNAVTSNIFNLHLKSVRQVMEPIHAFPLLASNATVDQVRKELGKSDKDFVFLYHRHLDNIVGIAYARSIVRLPSGKRVRDYAVAPWFVTQNSNVFQILNQFRYHNTDLAVILDAEGHACGVVRVEDITDEIFGLTSISNGKEEILSIERTFPGDMKISDFNEQFSVVLDDRGSMTLSELLIEHLGHQPEEGDSVYLPPFELTVKQTTLLGVKQVTITTHY